MLAPGFVVLALVGVGCNASAKDKPLAFRDVGNGISYARFEVRGKPTFSGHAFVVDLKKASAHIVSAGPARRVVKDLAASLPAHLAINASFFDKDEKTMGRVVDGGKTIVRDRRGAWGALVIDKGQARVDKGDALPPQEGGGDLVVQGIPRLVVGGQVQRLKPAEANRTAVCAEGTKLVVVVTTAPADTTDFARFLAKPTDKGGLGCTNALNLDGGPSTQLHVALPGLQLDVPGGWGVPNALVFSPR